MKPPEWQAPVIPIGHPTSTQPPAGARAIPSWDSVWLAVAYAIGRRSPCTLTRTGAAIVSYDNRIIAAGHHGPPDGYTRDTALCDVWCSRGAAIDLGTAPAADGADCPSLHAEAHALSDCGLRERAGGTMYVAGDVCFPCAKLIAASGLDRLVCAPTQTDDGGGYVFLQTCGISVVRIANVDNP